MTQPTTARYKVLTLPVIIAALGYFVDIYDLVLFSIVRVPSLKALGLQGQELMDQGVFLLNMQMARIHNHRRQQSRCCALRRWQGGL
jgi:MFS transporter, putative metabolite:H+ symporter